MTKKEENIHSHLMINEKINFSQVLLIYKEEKKKTELECQWKDEKIRELKEEIKKKNNRIKELELEKSL